MYSEYGLDPDGDLFDKLLVVIQHVKGCDEEATVYNIENRCATIVEHSDEYDELLETEEFVDACDEETLKDTMRHRAFLDKRRDSYNSVQTKVLGRVRQFADARRPAPPPELPPRTNPLDEHGNDLAIDVVQALLPPGSRVTKDGFKCRWQFFYGLQAGPRRTISRSWNIRTHKACVAEGLTQCWAWAEADMATCPYNF